MPGKKNHIKLHWKFWLESEAGEGILGEGKIRLLRAIAREGSLSLAAKTLGISYRKAWGDIKKAEKILGFALIEKHRGGVGGGNTVLTPVGIKLLKSYDRLEKKFEPQIQKAFNSFVNEIEKAASDITTNKTTK